MNDEDGMTKTERLLEYCDRTKQLDFPEHVEAAIENDYPENYMHYTELSFKKMKIVLFLMPDIEPDELIRLAKGALP